jgi:hypothetical protein
MLTTEYGLSLLPTSQATQFVPRLSAAATPAQTSPVTWRVQALRPGRFRVTVQSSTGETQTHTVVIRPRAIF